MSSDLDIIESGEFTGSLKELQARLKDDTFDQAWDDVGLAKRYVSGGLSLYWWPDSGELLQVVFHKHNLERASFVKWQDRRRNVRRENGGRWRQYEIAGLETMSLPQMVFRAPGYYFEEVFLCDEPGVFDKYEWAEVKDKVSAIRIPKSAPKNTRAIHSYTCPDGKYCGFELSAEKIGHVRRRGMILVEEHIDLRNCFLSFYGDLERASSTWLINALDGPDAPRIWDRARCEAFFDNESNFIPLTKKYQNEEPYAPNMLPSEDE